MVLVFVNFPVARNVIPRTVPASVVSEGVVLSVLWTEVFSISLVSRFHCAVGPTVSLSGCNVVDVYVGDFVYCGVYDFAIVVPPISHDLRLSRFLVNFDCMVHGILKSFDPRVYFHYFV